MSGRIDAISGLLLMLGRDKIRLASAHREPLRTVTTGQDLIELSLNRLNDIFAGSTPADQRGRRNPKPTIQLSPYFI
jgi:hypothetical protein